MLRSPVTLADLVPRDHFYRHVEQSLDLGFVRDVVHNTYAEAGRPSIDPVVFFTLPLVMFFAGVRAERQLLRVVADRLSLRWYLGYDLSESLPDHASLTRIREHRLDHLCDRFRISHFCAGLCRNERFTTCLENNVLLLTLLWRSCDGVAMNDPSWGQCPINKTAHQCPREFSVKQRAGTISENSSVPTYWPARCSLPH